MSQQTYLKLMANRSPCNRRKIIKEGILEHLEGEKNNKKNKDMSKYNRLFLLYLFLKLYLSVQAKSITSSDVDFNVYRGTV